MHVLLFVALLAYVDRAVAQFVDPSDITEMPRPTDVLRQDSQQLTDPNNRPTGDWFESLLRELNERGALEPLAPQLPQHSSPAVAPPRAGPGIVTAHPVSNDLGQRVCNDDEQEQYD
jgi:hypothetical protein